MEEKDENDVWISESEAAKRLGKKQSQIARLVQKGKIQTRKHKRDERLTLVNLKELMELYKEP